MSFKPSPHRGHRAASWSKIPQWLTPPGDQDNTLFAEKSRRIEETQRKAKGVAVGTKT